MKIIVLLLIAVSGLTGCATQAGKSPMLAERAQLLEIYQKHAGDNQSSVVFPRVRDWASVGDTYIALRTAGDRYYLVNLGPACADDLRRAGVIDIALEQETRNTLSVFDKVHIDNQRCSIQSIHKLDHQAIRAELEEKGLSTAFIRVERRD